VSTRQNIYLIGFSGSGKTSVGRRLARTLKIGFIDTDGMIVDRAGKDIGRIFADHGEAHFRRLEEQMIASLTHRVRSSMVVALGGGAFESKANRDHLSRSGIVIYLSCSLKVLYSRLRTMHDRPLLASSSGSGAGSAQKLQASIRKLRDKRIRHYKQADIHVSTSARTVAQTVGEIARRLKK